MALRFFKKDTIQEIFTYDKDTGIIGWVNKDFHRAPFPRFRYERGKYGGTIAISVYNESFTLNQIIGTLVYDNLYIKFRFIDKDTRNFKFSNLERR